jgi:hypothetical protein
MGLQADGQPGQIAGPTPCWQTSAETDTIEVDQVRFGPTARLNDQQIRGLQVPMGDLCRVHPPNEPAEAFGAISGRSEPLPDRKPGDPPPEQV